MIRVLPDYRMRSVAGLALVFAQRLTPCEPIAYQPNPGLPLPPGYATFLESPVAKQNTRKQDGSRPLHPGTMRIPPLKAIIAFESVARTKSVNRAADELGLTPSAVSHQIANLESMVGRPLFTRLGRGLVLTPTGQQYLADVTGSLADLSRATERASSQTGVEILRIHSSPSFGLMWLLPRLASFQEANDDIQLNLACSYEDVSFTSGYYDVDVRHGYAHWTDGEVKTLRNEFIAPLASEEYLQKISGAHARGPARAAPDLLGNAARAVEAMVRQVRRRCVAQGIRFLLRPLVHVARSRGVGTRHRARKHDARVGPSQTRFARAGLRSHVSRSKSEPITWFTRPKTPICRASPSFWPGSSKRSAVTP